MKRKDSKGKWNINGKIEYFENIPGLAHHLVHKSQDNEPPEIHFTHSTHLSNPAQLVCGDVTEITSEEVVVVRHSKSKGKETGRLRYDCLVICSGRRYLKTTEHLYTLILIWWWYLHRFLWLLEISVSGRWGSITCSKDQVHQFAKRYDQEGRDFTCSRRRYPFFPH